MTDSQVILFTVSCIIFAFIIWNKIGLFNNIIHRIKYIIKVPKYLK